VKKPVLDETYRLWLLLSQTRSAVFKLRHKKEGKYLHPNQAAALIAIWYMDGQMTPAVLSRHLFLEPNSVSELIIRMEKKGIVTKTKDRTRGNSVRIAVTEKGLQVCQRIMGQGLVHRIMSSLTE